MSEIKILPSGYRCADCKAPLRPGYTCDACDSDAAEEVDKPGASPETHPDDVAVDMFAKAMKEKLAQARAKGRSGWQTCNKYELSSMLRAHVDKGDPRDVANFCMFLYALGHRLILPPPLPAEKRCTRCEYIGHCDCEVTEGK